VYVQTVGPLPNSSILMLGISTDSGTYPVNFYVTKC
jgi:hypothetical protein